MNYAIVFRLLGYVMLIEGALLLLPAAASWIYGEWFVLGVFLITAAVSAAIGYALRGIKPKSKMFYAGGLCCYLAELDRHFHRGRRSVCGDGLHPEPGGRPV